MTGKRPTSSSRPPPGISRKRWNLKKTQHHPLPPILGIRNVTNKRSDDFSDSFYYRAIRTKIGDALRSQWAPTEPVPQRLLDLLQELDRPSVDGSEEKPERPEEQRDQ